MEYNVITEKDAERAQVIVPGELRATESPSRALESTEGGTPPPPPPPAAVEAQATPAAFDRDDALDRLFKYIPSVTVGTYLAIQGVIVQVSNETTRKWTLLIVSLVLLAGTYLFLRQRNVKRPAQILASLGAFVVWVFALGGPFDSFWAGYETWMGSIALFLGAFLLAAWNPPPLEPT